MKPSQIKTECELIYLLIIVSLPNENYTSTYPSYPATLSEE